VLSIFVFFMPNALGDSENYVMANPMQTPAAIVPEWYLLPFYAILSLLILPYVDFSNLRGIQDKPLSKIAFFIFIANFLILMQLGAKHVEAPYIEFGQICTAIYFSYFLVIVPVVSLIENSLLYSTNK
jgi:ubiquinol-cytochrome c reductase cytochrome b subunit